MCHHSDRKNRLFFIGYIPIHSIRFCIPKLPCGGGLCSRIISCLHRKVPKDGVDKANKALTIIGLTLDPSQYKLVNQCENGVEVWYKLADHYEKNSWANHIWLMQAFYNFKHDLDMLINEYIQGLEAIWNQMCRIRMSITNLDLADALIMNLNLNFNPIASSLTSQGSELMVAEVMDVL